MTAIYHITHLRNLPGLAASGLLLSDSQIRAARLTPVQIAHGHIKQRRATVQVTIAPGGVVADYVPFYFCPRSPMLYAVHGGQVQGYPGGQGDLVHLVADAETLAAHGCTCIHTYGNAASQPLTFFPGTTTLPSALDWSVIHPRSWGNTIADNDRKRRKQAEFLVWNSVPWTAISQIGVINATMALRVGQALAGATHRPMVQSGSVGTTCGRASSRCLPRCHRYACSCSRRPARRLPPSSRCERQSPH